MILKPEMCSLWMQKLLVEGYCNPNKDLQSSDKMNQKDKVTNTSTDRRVIIVDEIMRRKLQLFRRVAYKIKSETRVCCDRSLPEAAVATRLLDRYAEQECESYHRTQPSLDSAAMREQNGTDIARMHQSFYCAIDF